MLVGILCTRYRDLPPIVANVMQIIFFMSPIMYKPITLPARLSFIVNLNPVFYLVEAVRAPLLGEVAESENILWSWPTFAVIGWIVTFRFFKIVRSRVPYWV